MRKSIMWAAISALAVCLGIFIAGCGGTSTQSNVVSGSVMGTSALRSSTLQYTPLSDYTVYAVNARTGVTVSASDTTDSNGRFSLFIKPDSGDLEIVAEKEGVCLKAYIRAQDRQRARLHDVDPDTTVASSVAEQLRLQECTEEQVAHMYLLCLSYQVANRFNYGHNGGTACDLADIDDTALTARECVRATANDAIRLAIANRNEGTCRNMIALGMADASLNEGCQLRLTEEQRERLTIRTCEGGIWTNAEAADLLKQAGINLDAGGEITEAEVLQARDRLQTRLQALVQDRICAAEILLLCVQTDDTNIPFHARTQQQLDALMDLIAPAQS